MKEINADLWDLTGGLICITTNGFVKKNGEAVLGAGCAKEAVQRFPEFPRILGSKLKQFGNKVFYIPEFNLFTFPVKHNWWEDADIELIKKSCTQLVDKVKGMNNAFPTGTPIYLPQPGCGNGRLKWEFVREQIKDLLPDWVVIVDFPITSETSMYGTVYKQNGKVIPEPTQYIPTGRYELSWLPKFNH